MAKLDSITTTKKSRKKSTSKPLTDTFIRKARLGTYPDGACPGLRLRVGKTRKVWLYRYREKATQKLKQVSLGRYPRMPLAAARAQWNELQAVRGDGKDVKREFQRQEEGEFTVTRLVDYYLDTYAKILKRSWKEDQRMLENDITPKWGDRPAVEITRAEGIALLTKMVPRGERGAQLLLAAARKAWNHAIDHEYIQSNPFARLKIVKGVVMSTDTRVRTTKRKPRYLNCKEINTFLTKLPTADMRDSIKDILLLQLLTASRKGEVCTIRWDEVDEKVWTLPEAKAKNGQEHRVMLSRQALKLIKAQPEVNEYVFAANTSSGHIRPDSVNEVASSNQKHFKLKHWTPHALRHTALTGLSELGANREIQNRISNHKDSSIAALYDHNQRDDEARKWLQKWANHLDLLAKKNVVPS